MRAQRLALTITAMSGLTAVVLLHPDLSAGQATSAAAVTLPAPTGSFAVGRVTLHWTDRSRVEPLDPDRRARELMVDVWYPAVSAIGPTADYFDVAAFNDAPNAGRLKSYFRAAYDAIKAGRVRTHAIERAPFAGSVRSSPILVFSHGGGETRETYSAQMEDLASHGYVVAAITHTYDAVVTRFPDGRTIMLAPGRWRPFTETLLEGTPPLRGANPEQWRWWAEDIRFVLNELSRSNRTPSSSMPFAGHVDLARVGAFGHSAGGEAAATACQIDRRIRACLNQDGVSLRAPYNLDSRGWGMDQAFMLMVRAEPTGPPPDDELAAMKITRSQALELARRLDARQDASLRNTGKGSYRVILRSEGTTHDDFGDLPLLQSRDLAEADHHTQILSVVRNYTRSFFDKTLKGTKATLLDDNAVNEFVDVVETFPPATRPKDRR